MRNLILSLLLLSSACANAETGDSIYWSDGDSGRLGDVKFRLANVDAPETGGVGAVGGAKCEAERTLGFEAKAFMVELTRKGEVSISKEYGEDRYGRIVVDLAVGDDGLSIKGVNAGHLRAWPHKGRRALKPKPDWCANAAATNNAN